MPAVVSAALLGVTPSLVPATALADSGPAPQSTAAEAGPAGAVLKSKVVVADVTPSARVGDTPARDGFFDSFVLDTARAEPLRPNKDFLLFSFHGEYELRFRAQTDLPLEAPVSQPTHTLLGQNAYLYHWLRLRPRLEIGDNVSIVGQIDIPRGLFIGDKTQDVTAARDSFSTYNWYDVHPRELYVEWRSPIGTVRVGQQANHWGMGLVANDGDHPQIFGDTQRGSLVERVLYAGQPFKKVPFFIALGGDLVFQDTTANLLDGDHVLQGVLAAFYKNDFAELGFYGVIRHQWANDEAIDSYTPFGSFLTVGVLDIAGKIRGKIPGTNSYAYVEGEGAAIFGETSFVKGSYGNSIYPTAPKNNELIQQIGAAAKVGFVHTNKDEKQAWGDVVAEVEVGYASGDGNPFDGTSKTFTFDQNHTVGLILFNDVLRWKTARSATNAADAGLVNRPTPGLRYLPSEGGVFGATYLNPRFILRPKRWADVKLGFVLAQSTADVVDPYQAGAKGNFANYDGGDDTRHDLGFEIDTGFNFRIPLERTTHLELGAEGGVLFPGRAFDDRYGNGLPMQYLVNTKAGMQF